MIVALPHLTTETYPYTPEATTRFSTINLATNIAHIEKALGKKHWFTNHINTIVGKYAEVIDNVNYIDWIKPYSATLNTIKAWPEDETDPEQYKHGILQTVTNPGEYLFFSDTHASSGPLITICKQQNPKMRIGVICFDAHADIYDTNAPLWKGNVFSKLIHEDVIEELLVIGVPDFRRKNAFRDTPPDIIKRVTFAHHQSRQELTAGFEKLAKATSHVFYSFDPDCLDSFESQYTAMEYCPFHLILNLGLIELDDELLGHQDELIAKVGRPQGQYGPRNLLQFGEDISLQDLQGLVTDSGAYLVQHRVEIGLDTGECRVLADVVELFGPDFRSNTMRAARKMAQAIERLARASR